MPRFRFVFTPVGIVVLVIALVGLIRALLLRNSYEILLASAALLLLLVLSVIGIWKTKKLKALEPGWKPPFPMTAQAGEETIVSSLSEQIPLFFRLHFIIRGKFFPSSSKIGSSVFVETSVPRSETSARILLDFPMSGVFKGDGYCMLRDIFGFFSFSCGLPQHRTVNVRCSPCFGKDIPINAQTGAEDQRNKPAADIERYYMREYTPGDRFRDINWKSSEKIDALITRISTDNQERISRIEVHFRNYGLTYGQKESLEGLWLLDRAKARLSYFLRSVMEKNSSLIFDVRTASGDWEIENLDDLDTFFEVLSGLSFMPQTETVLSPGAGDMYVFSTACDAGLSSFLLANNNRPISLFMIQPQTTEKNQTASSFGSWLNKTEKTFDDIEILKLSDFESKGCAVPAQLLVRSKVKPLNVQTNRIETFFAGIKL